MNTVHSKNRLQYFKTYCLQNGIKITPLREKIFALICASNQPIGAYDLLRLLRQSHASAEPPTVYRVLEFFQEKHLIHRVESKNAYIPCFQPEEIHQNQLFICMGCGTTLEVKDKKVINAVKNCAKSYGFQLESELTEIRGRCQNCQ